MTTIQEVYNAVKLRYMRECNTRKVPQTEISNGEFKLMYDIIQHEIFRKLNITDADIDIAITPVSVFTEYALPSNFGSLRSYECVFSNTKVDLELKDRTEMPTGGSLAQGTPNRISIYPKSDGLHYVYLYPVSGFTGTLTVRYKLLTDINDGGGANEDLSKSTVLPIQYKHLLLHGIMGELFSDMKPAYYAYIDDANGDRAVPVKPTTNYQLGFDEDGQNETNIGL
jgi:hypothetical protein